MVWQLCEASGMSEHPLTMTMIIRTLWLDHWHARPDIQRQDCHIPTQKGVSMFAQTAREKQRYAIYARRTCQVLSENQ